MTQYAVSFFTTSLVMAVIIIGILAITVLFPKVFRAKLRYTIWVVVLIGLLVPLRPMIGNGFITVLLPAESQHGGYEDSAGAQSDYAQGTEDSSVWNDMSAGRDVSPIVIGVLVWAIAAVATFVYHIFRYVRFLRLTERWGVPVTDDAVLSTLKAIQSKMGLGDKKIDLKICGFVSSSMLTGFLRPLIIVPEKHFETDELELIFLHELIHYKRRDLLIKLLSLIAVSIHWFNPAVHRMCAAMQADGEASCDEAVMDVAGYENKHFYAEVIIGMIGRKKTSTMLATCFYGGKNNIKKRLCSIMDGAGKARQPIASSLIIVAAMTLFSGSIFAFAAQGQTAAPPLSAEAPAETPGSIPTPQVIQNVPDTSSTPVMPEIELPPDENSPPPSSQNTLMSADEARAIAIAAVGGGTVIEYELDFEDGRWVFEIEIIFDGYEYDIEVDAITGEISDYSVERTSRGR